ncbi:unnamed protein product, partial [Brassica rapa subsp. trilocularis]
ISLIHGAILNCLITQQKKIIVTTRRALTLRSKRGLHSEAAKVFSTVRMATTTGLESLVDQIISVITNDGRNIVGVLKGFDQATNIILDESHERVFSTKEGVQQLVLGLYIIRGDNM